MTTAHVAGRVAEHYDESSAEMFDPAVVGPAVDLLGELAGDGAALEPGIDTGRLALPLRRSQPRGDVTFSGEMRTSRRTWSRPPNHGYGRPM